MAREKIQVRKIDNATARQVTFSKRRRGLFKKAEELSVLCDAEVGLVIFSATGKLFEFASSSMKDIIEKRSMHSKEILQDKPSLDLNLENCNFSSLRKTVVEATQQLRKTKGEDLKGLSIEELQQLEITLQTGLDRVLEKKGEHIMQKISALENKGLQLKEENTRLRQQMELDMSTVGKQVVTGSENGLYEDGQSSESVTNASHSGVPPQDYDDSFDTSLKLGLPWKESKVTMMQ